MDENINKQGDENLPKNTENTENIVENNLDQPAEKNIDYSSHEEPVKPSQEEIRTSLSAVEEQEAQNEKNSRREKWMRNLGRLFIVLGILGILLPYFNSYLLRKNSEISLAGITAEEMQENAREIEGIDFENITEIGHFNFWSQLGKWKTEDIIGELIIPDLDIRLTVFNNARNESILAGVGVLMPNRQPDLGNFVLTGHHVQAKGVLLHNLMDAQLDSKVYFSDKDKVYVYRIVETKQTDTDAVEMLGQDQVQNYQGAHSILSIMTCYQGKVSSRWFVIAQYEETMEYEDFEKMLQ